MLNMYFIEENGSKESRLKSTLIVVLLTLTLLISISSCTKEEISEDRLHEKSGVEATFKTTINIDKNRKIFSTRASGTLWETGDAIGIFALLNGNTEPDPLIFNAKENIKYINNTAGITANFSAADKPILFPGSNEMLDFIAYYPYSVNGVIGGTETGTGFGSSTGNGSISDFNLQIDVSQQSPQSAIDLMYAKATGHNSESPEVGLTFNHSLSLFELTIVTEQYINLEATEITIHNALTNGSMSLKDGVVTPADAASGDIITPVTAYNSTENSITATTIMLPGWDLSQANINILASNGSMYIWQPVEYKLQPGKRKRYRLKLTPDSIEMTGTTSTITEWLDEPVVELEDIAPVGKIGNGTEDSPYTVAQAIVKQGEEGVWVEGYIMGYMKSGTPPTLLNDPSNPLSTANIALSDKDSESVTSKMIPIKFIIANEPYKQLNLQDNNDLIGSRVKVYCNLINLYNVPGGDELSNFKII